MPSGIRPYFIFFIYIYLSSSKNLTPKLQPVVLRYFPNVKKSDKIVDYQRFTVSKINFGEYVTAPGHRWRRFAAIRISEHQKIRQNRWQSTINRQAKTNGGRYVTLPPPPPSGGDRFIALRLSPKSNTLSLPSCVTDAILGVSERVPVLVLLQSGV